MWPWVTLTWLNKMRAFSKNILQRSSLWPNPQIFFWQSITKLTSSSSRLIFLLGYSFPRKPLFWCLILFLFSSHDDKFRATWISIRAELFGLLQTWINLELFSSHMHFMCRAHSFYPKGFEFIFIWFCSLLLRKCIWIEKAFMLH